MRRLALVAVLSASISAGLELTGFLSGRQGSADGVAGFVARGR